MLSVPLDTGNDIRATVMVGRSRSEMILTLHLGRNTVANCADIEVMPLVGPLPAERDGSALEGCERWVEGSQR